MGKKECLQYLIVKQKPLSKEDLKTLDHLEDKLAFEDIIL
jgi:hypothetical protein